MASEEKRAEISAKSATHLEDSAIAHKDITVAAQEQSQFEHHLSVRDTLRDYPMAIFWSLMVSMCVVMEGYDTILIGNFYAYPAFAHKFGVHTKSEGYQVTAPWQAGLGNAAGIGAFFGALLNGYLVTKFGMKRIILGSLVVLLAFLFIVFFAPNIAVLTVGELLCGLPWGIFATTAPAYASEVLPLSLRVYLTSYTNMCFIMGQLIAAGVLNGCLSIQGDWSYRIPFAIQWVWPCFLIPILAFAPESPWHLVRAGRIAEAEKSLRRLQRSSVSIDVQKTLSQIIYTNSLEEELTVGTSYKDCFKGFELRRTEIACMVFAGQIFTGLLFAYNASYFFQQIGLGTPTIYKLTLGGSGLALLGTLFSWFLVMPYFGRRTIYLWGTAVMTTMLYLIGILNVKTHNRSVAMTQAVLTLTWTFCFQVTVGQLGWALPAEMGSTRLRQKTICLARNAYYVTSVVGSVLQPYMMNPTAWNLKGYTGFFWGTASLLLLIWGIFRLPETKDRTFEEIDVLFAKAVPARKFAKTDVDAFTDSDVRQLGGRGSISV